MQIFLRDYLGIGGSLKVFKDLNDFRDFKDIRDLKDFGDVEAFGRLMLFADSRFFLKFDGQ